MKFIKYLLLGVLFGITLTKAEVISWFRIYEMFRFQSFHMYGVIGSAVVIGVILVQWIKRSKMKTINGEHIVIESKEKGFWRYLLGGILFGLGWALTGACPGPLFILFGNGVGVALVMIVSAMLGTFVYGLMRHRLPH
jgi:hypothetical protein